MGAYRYLEDGTIAGPEGAIPCDPLNRDYQEILRRISEEGLVVDPYVPPPEPLPKDKRAARYKTECDPLLLATYGYELEVEAEADPTKKAAVEVKRDKAKVDYLAAKAKIRTEIPD